MKKSLSVLAVSLSISAGAAAQVTVSAPWVRATVPAQNSTGAFLVLQSASAARLVKVASPVGVAELHQMEMKGDMMQMRRVDSIALAAGKPTVLASGGYHIMLMGLKRQLKAGEKVPLTLEVQDNKSKKRTTVALEATVQPLTYISPAAKAH
jgi:copper(I)-binding protein